MVDSYLLYRDFCSKVVGRLNQPLAWINRLEKYHPKLIESMGEELIRKQMLKKYENKCFNSHIANDKTFVKDACSQDILNF
jgi:ParB family chromosome partitioning protein